MNRLLLIEKLGQLRRGQSGAIAVLCLAAMLIIMLMGLVIFDSIEIANEKVHLQASADAAAFSQSSIEARTMNMTAFTNVGKRINVAYVTAYDTIMGWLGWLVGAGWVLTILCAAAAVLTAGGLAGVCKKMAQIVAGATCVWAKELVDQNRLSEVISNTFGPELRAFNNYQQYKADITPYWAWSEGVWKGIENRAPITMGYPAPKGGSDVNYSSQLPIRQASGHSWDGMCEKTNYAPSIGDIVLGDTFDALTEQVDRWYMFVDFIIKNGISIIGGADGEVTGDGDFDGGGGAGDLEDQCGDMEERAEQDPDNFKYDPGEDCEDADDDDDCEESPPTMSYRDADGNWVDEELTENCIPIDIADALNELDCSDISAAGVYGSVFFAGSLALLVDHSGLPGWISWAFPTSYKDRCGGSGSREAQNSGRYGSFVQDGAPWELNTSDWSMHSSTLTFAYRPNAARNQASRDKYSIGEEVNDGFFTSSSEASGVWALSRGEITWQGEDDTPNLWESQWGARVRPVALPGEWENYGSSGDFTIWEALQEIENEMFGALIVAHGADFLNVSDAASLITHPYGASDLSSFSGLQSIYEEYQSTRKSFEAMDNEKMEGLVK